ncbi:MAG: RecQ family ATP-dependent DNA helicase [Gemmatimonadota bacterium]|nr:RecQ family ATP-dependent DNA helicase [Gemmatimonadota bacterium]
MTEKTDALKLLRLATNERTVEFRRGQWEAIDSLVNERARLLVVERTGWGKSSVYFIATRILRNRGRGPTLIVSPLLALMRNQIDAARRLGIRAMTINSANREEWPVIRRAVRENEADALLISPERLANDEFVENVLLPVASRIGLLVVDEAHCISDWGHDFRPDYRRLVRVLQRMPGSVPILGTTATANDRVVEDVRAQLGDFSIQRGNLVRRTLALQKMRLPSQVERLAWLAEHIDSLPGTGIIYTLTRRDANQVEKWLRNHGISSRAYYSGVKRDDFEDSNAYRLHLEQKLLRNEIKALVATTALGMGYDKPDIGFVVHYQAPGSIVAYYQQVGRAGRAISHAIGLLMSGDEDADIHEYFRQSAFPEEAWVSAVLGVLEESDGLRVSQIEKAVNLTRGQIGQVLKFLSVDRHAPVIKSGYKWARTAVPYRMDRERIRRLTEKREIEWQEVQEYLETDRCLMAFLTRALDDVAPQPCGKCASCRRRPLVDSSFTRTTAIAAARFLRHSELALVCNRQVARDAFREYGFRGNLPQDVRAETGRILSRWGDAGWGQLVAEDKHRGHFRDELVNAVVEMLKERWKPSPTPKWVTCVPSRNRPDLVPDYAKRLAAALGLTFDPIVAKVKNNDPQKLQQNRFHQCTNLDGAFAIGRPVPDGPVLLVDDVVDSGWTLTAIAALLRQTGSGPVWPLALATSRMAD